PLWWPEIAAATSTSTSTGATALRASTKAVPTISSAAPAAGQATPTRVPTTRAMTIWVTRLGRRRNAGSAMRENLLWEVGSGGLRGRRRQAAVDDRRDHGDHQHRHRPAQAHRRARQQVQLLGDPA